MPRGNGTGPMGYGSMTGRSAGYCGGYQAPGFMNQSFGCGFGRSRGRGMGFRRGAGWESFAPGYSQAAAPSGVPTVPDEQQHLKEQSLMLQDQLANIQKRIDELAVQQDKDK